VEDRGEASEEDKAAAAKSGEEIYIGFDKSDGAPRKGRKGRVLNDDPSRCHLHPPLSSRPHQPPDDYSLWGARGDSYVLPLSLWVPRSGCHWSYISDH